MHYCDVHNMPCSKVPPQSVGTALLLLPPHTRTHARGPLGGVGKCASARVAPPPLLAPLLLLPMPLLRLLLALSLLLPPPPLPSLLPRLLLLLLLPTMPPLPLLLLLPPMPLRFLGRRSPLLQPLLLLLLPLLPQRPRMRMYESHRSLWAPHRCLRTYMTICIHMCESHRSLWAPHDVPRPPPPPSLDMHDHARTNV